jgi:hypothetical protein
MLEFFKIFFVCILSAIVYGIVHDQITARVCLEYFTVFHPPVFQTQSPTLLALGWGVLATWWVGAFLGFLLGIASRAGSYPKLSAGTLLKPIGKLLALMFGCSLSAGLLGFVLTQRGIIVPPKWTANNLAAAVNPSFMADCWAHSASYVVGLMGGIALCVMQYLRRRRSKL